MISELPNSILLETSRCDDENYRSYLFINPVRVLTLHSLDEIPVLFSQIEGCLGKGKFVAGFMSYECGHHFEPAVNKDFSDSSLPLAWFGAYERPYVFNHISGQFEGAMPLCMKHFCNRDAAQNNSRSRHSASSSGAKEDASVEMTGTGIHDNSESAITISGPCTKDFAMSDCRFGLDRADYCARIEAIKDYIRAGDTYQVNLTSKIAADFSGSAASLYAALRERQKVPYAAFLHGEDWDILSYSPELFFRIENGRMITRPMKGTASRGCDSTEDIRIRTWLHEDAKNRSENVMIVDLLRNDLGKIAETGSIKVDNLFAVEKYETLLQMTSTVSATLRPGKTFYEIFRALFPSGSVTGAPKFRTMQIIDELEDAPRGVYTGAIGYFTPNRDAVFNVAIRTIVMTGNSAEMGVGSGIVFDSDGEQEYAECQLKAQFLTQRQPYFQLIESLLWDGDYYLLDRHLQRLKSSAEYFCFVFNESEIVAALEKNGKHLSTLREERCLNSSPTSAAKAGAEDEPATAAINRCATQNPARDQTFPRPDEAGSRYKVRLLLDMDGAISIENATIGPQSSVKGTVMVSPHRVHSKDRFLYHKTTHRDVYERLQAEAARQGHEDVLFVNERGEITEGTYNNVFVEIGGKLYTPPVACGLLPGVLRQHILENDPRASERILAVQDLATADAIYLCNSVRVLRQVELSAQVRTYLINEQKGWPPNLPQGLKP